MAKKDPEHIAIPGVASPEEIWTEPDIELVKELHGGYEAKYEAAKEARTDEGNLMARSIRFHVLEHTHGRLRQEDEYYDLTQLHVQDQATGRPVPFQPFEYQKEVWDYFRECEASGKPCRIQILKARKMGFSTLVESEFYRKTRSNPGTQAAVMAHEAKASVEIAGIYKTFHDTDLSHTVRVNNQIINREAIITTGGNQLSVRFKRGGGKVVLHTGNNPDAIRSGTFQYLHLSEFAHFKDRNNRDLGEDTLKAASFAVAEAPGTVIVIESTANGVGNLFAEIWEDEASGWHKFFFPWQADPRCAIPICDKDYVMMMMGLPKEARRMMEEFGLTREQMAYWWKKYKSNNNSLAGTFQEIPHTAEVAFQSSRRNLFTVPDIQPHEVHVKEFREKNEIKRFIIAGNEMEEHPEGPLWIFREPQAGRSYGAGVDVAEGLIVGPGSSRESADYSAVIILGYPQAEKESPQFAAVYNDRPPVEELPRILDVIGSYYNCAQMNIERNNHGITVIKLMQILRGYPFICKEIAFDKNPKTNIYADATPRKKGWLTNEGNRRHMFATLTSYVRKLGILIPSEEVLDQVSRLVVNTAGKPLAPVGHHDDLVIALCIALETILFIPAAPPLARLPKSMLPGGDSMSPLALIKGGGELGQVMRQVRDDRSPLEKLLEARKQEAAKQ